jgi:acetyltransferase
VEAASGSIRLRDGAVVSVRPLRPADRERFRGIVERVSVETLTNRFLGPRRPLTEDDMTELLDVGHGGKEALAVLDTEGSIIAIGRLAPVRDKTGACEVALVVADDWQKRGVGTALLERLVAVATALGYADVQATTLLSNRPISKVLSRVGFRSSGVSAGVADWSMDLPRGTERTTRADD